MRFFVSYNKADRDWAEWVAWQLEDLGHAVVIQAWDFSPGSNFVLEMHRAVGGCDRTIAILSPEFLTSPFTAAEWAAAFARDPDGMAGGLIPIRVRECDPTGLLGQVVYLDLVGQDEPTARRSLESWLADLVAGRRKPTLAPDFPDEHDGATSRSAFRADYEADLQWYADRSSVRHFELAEALGLTKPFDSGQVEIRWQASEQLPLQVLLGRGRTGERVTLDLQADGPCGYLLGSSGTGTSTLLRGVALGLASTYSPRRVRFALVGRRDGSVFRDIADLPHVLTHLDAAHWDRDDLGRTLSDSLRERMELFAQARVRDFGEYNQRQRDHGGEPLPFLLVLVDECTDHELLDQLTRFQSRGRSLGVGLIVAFQSDRLLNPPFLAVARFGILQGSLHLGLIGALNDPGGGLRDYAAASAALRWASGRSLLVRSSASYQVFQAPYVAWGRETFDSPYLTSPEISAIVAAISSAGERTISIRP